jgi:hypothetical protein
MTVGLAATTFANKVLDHMLRAVASTAPASNNIQMHTADPGAAGTTATIAGATSRQAVTFSAASAGACASSNTPSFTSFAGTSPSTVSHISVWDASSAGNFLYSAALTTSKTITMGDTFTLSSLSVSLAPIAA